VSSSCANFEATEAGCQLARHHPYPEIPTRQVHQDSRAMFGSNGKPPLLVMAR
jgi:hypothetical protein